MFCDSEIGKYVPSVDQIRAVVTDKTRVLLIPNLIGNVPDWKALREALVQVRSSDMSGAEKRDAIGELTEAQNQLTAQIKLFKKELSKS